MKEETAIFQLSFNIPDIFYEVKEKDSGLISTVYDIIDWIKDNENGWFIEQQIHCQTLSPKDRW